MYTADDTTTWHLQADLAVVGASGGGLLAAIAAALNGCRVVLCERAKELGGGLARERGMLAAAGTKLQRDAGVADDCEAFSTDPLAQNPVQPGHGRAWCRAAADLVEWITAFGVSSLVFVPKLVARGHVAPRMHVHEAGSGEGLLADLVRAAANQAHIAVRTGCVIEDLWADASGAIAGIAAREKRGPVNIAARRVLLACGGFAANSELAREHLGELAAIPYAGSPGALGDALRWGITLGAATAGLQGSLLSPSVTIPGGSVVPDDVLRNGAIMVNQLGHRFADETMPAGQLARAVLEQPGRVAYLIFDERIYRLVRDADPYFARLITPRAVRHDASAADLGRHLEVEADNLLPTLEGLHAGVVRRTDPFGREEAGQPFSPPFHGLRVTAARLRTLGGLQITDHAEVVREDGGTVPNLFASGGAAADPWGADSGERSFGNYGLTSFVWGWMVGAAARPEGEA